MFIFLINYSRFKNRIGAISDSIVDSFSGLVAVLPALLNNQKAIDFLVEQEEGRQNRRNVAEVFGDKFGTFWKQYFQKLVVPSFVFIVFV